MRWKTNDGKIVILSRRERDEAGLLYDVWLSEDGIELHVPTRHGIPFDWKMADV